MYVRQRTLVKAYFAVGKVRIPNVGSRLSMQDICEGFYAVRLVLQRAFLQSLDISVIGESQ